jgi:hypothetical protein
MPVICGRGSSAWTPNGCDQGLVVCQWAPTGLAAARWAARFELAGEQLVRVAGDVFGHVIEVDPQSDHGGLVDDNLDAA